MYILKCKEYLMTNEEFIQITESNERSIAKVVNNKLLTSDNFTHLLLTLIFCVEFIRFGLELARVLE